jgi:hypothetical protein
MAITQIPPPDKSLQVFLAGLGVKAPDDARTLQFSLPLYVLSVAALRNNAERPQLQLVGWQFLTKDAQGKLVVGEVPNEADADGQPTTSLARGSTIEDALKAYGIVIAQPDLPKGNFVLRRLRMSALRIDAFWLKATPNDAGGEQNAPAADSIADGDYVFSFVAFQENLKFKLVPAPEFLRVARELSAGFGKHQLVSSVP